MENNIHAEASKGFAMMTDVYTEKHIKNLNLIIGMLISDIGEQPSKELVIETARKIEAETDKLMMQLVQEKNIQRGAAVTVISLALSLFTRKELAEIDKTIKEAMADVIVEQAKRNLDDIQYNP